MNEKLLQTPEGVRDIYGDEMKKKQTITGKIHDVLSRFGYQDIETPSFEFFDIFNMEIGSAPSNEMYKFFDRNNETLVLRPDITPSIARSVAKYYADEALPVRLSYEGKCFVNAHQHQGKLSEFTQIGGEMINDDSSASDADSIACVINCLLAAGLHEFQIEIGDVSFFKGLIEEAGFGEAEEKRIRAYISDKNFYGLSDYIEKLSIDDSTKKVFSSLDRLFGNAEILEDAKSLVKNETSLEAIRRLTSVYAALSSYGLTEYVSFDLSMISRFHYYTGIVFRGYTYGTGDAVVTGGRYNHLLTQFGKDAPAVGFAIYVDDLMNALSRNKIAIEVSHTDALVVYERAHQEAAIKFAEKLRGDGESTMLVRKSDKQSMDAYKAYAERMQFKKMITFREDGDYEISDICTC